MTDPKTIWLEPSQCRRRGCKMLPAGMRANRMSAGSRPDPCPTCGRQPTEYVKKSP